VKIVAFSELLRQGLLATRAEIVIDNAPRWAGWRSSAFRAVRRSWRLMSLPRARARGLGPSSASRVEQLLPVLALRLGVVWIVAVNGKETILRARRSPPVPLRAAPLHPFAAPGRAVIGRSARTRRAHQRFAADKAGFQHFALPPTRFNSRPRTKTAPPVSTPN
jgi:hypothetical protein